ncbi:MAG: CpaD family pilus assembly protein [Pseudomonadota bacterium]
MTLTSKSKSGAKLMIAVSLTAVALAGCRHLENPGTKVAAWNLVDPAQRHPIMVSQQPTEMSVHVRSGQHQLTPHQRAQVLSFVQHFRANDSGNGRIIIAAPSGSANEVAGMHAVRDLRALIAEEGIGDSDMIVEAYQADGSRQPPVKLSFLRYVAEAPECGHFPTNLASEPGNLPYPNFGCATQKSFAAQVANPADLLDPRTLTARSSERRDVTWNKYVKGEISAAEKSEDERIRVEDE